MPPAWAIAFLLSSPAARLFSAHTAFASACADPPLYQGRDAFCDHRAPDIAVGKSGVRAGQGERRVGADEPRGGRRQQEGVREELVVGELNSRVIRWVNKVLMVDSTVPVSRAVISRYCRGSGGGQEGLNNS
eukprot:3014866-Pyramimonas_sp.AAC.1